MGMIEDEETTANDGLAISFTPFWSQIVDGLSATLDFSESGRLFDFVNKTVVVFETNITDEGSAASPTKGSAFLRRNSVCHVVGDALTEISLDDDEEEEWEINHVFLEEGTRVLWIHPKNDVFFCVSTTSAPSSSPSSSSSSSLQMRSLKFNTLLASQAVGAEYSSFHHRACCTVGDYFCVVDGNQLSLYPYAFPTTSSLLSSHFGKKLPPTIDSPSLPHHLSNGQTTTNSRSWHQCRKRGWSYFQDAADDGETSARRPRQDEAAASLKIPASSAEEEASFLEQLRRRDASSQTKTELARMFDTLVEILLEKLERQKDDASKASFWPNNLFRFLMSSSVVNKWDSVIDLLVRRSDLTSIDLALRQPGIDAVSLCRLLRFCISLPDDDDEEKDKTDSKDSSSPSSPSSVVSKTQLLLGIVTAPVREENARKALKAFRDDEIDDILETLVSLLKRGDEEEDDVDAEEDGVVAPKPSHSSVRHAALFRWITLLVDSHFFQFVIGNDERRSHLLQRAESAVHEVEAYFMTRDGLDRLMDDMRRRAALSNKGKPLKTSMGREDDYCIQVFEI